MGLLLKALYGLKQAPHLWYKELKSFLITLKYMPIPANPYVFISQQSGQIIIIYVNDLILIRRDIQTIKLLKEALRNKYKVRDLGLITYYLGIQIIRNSQGQSIQLVQDAYIRKILHTFHIEDCAPASTLIHPSIVDFKPHELKDQAPQELVKQYQSLIGSLLYPY